MAPSEAAAADVRAHTHPADLAPETGNRAFWRRKSARADATPAHAVPHLKVVDQEIRGSSKKSSSDGELAAGLAAMTRAAEESDWNEELMSPVEAIKQIAPAKGEASNWIIWSAMTVAGLARAVLVSLGYLVARGADTRIKAGAITGLLMAVILISWLAGSAA